MQRLVPAAQRDGVVFVRSLRGVFAGWLVFVSSILQAAPNWLHWGASSWAVSSPSLFGVGGTRFFCSVRRVFSARSDVRVERRIVAALHAPNHFGSSDF
jgi:hypothetical protein